MPPAAIIAKPYSIITNCTFSEINGSAIVVQSEGPIVVKGFKQKIKTILNVILHKSIPTGSSVIVSNCTFIYKDQSTK